MTARKPATPNATKLFDQAELTSLFCARPQNFAWFLGAGASRSAGLSTANDILWDMKRRHYCREENQEIAKQDVQNDAVKQRIQAYLESKGFPQEWADDEYPTYFEKIFGADKERQRRYLKAMLSEDRVTLSIGHRVLGALIAGGFARAVFTTNFDTVVEKAVAEVSGQSLSAFHLEGSHAANQALNNEEFPIYCKLHGDFRYDSLKNLPADLVKPNTALAECLANAGNRFGFVVSGYSGRDRSIMDLFHSVLESKNAFPHGLFWTGIKGSPILPAVSILIDAARQKGITAAYVPIETFDALLLRLWRNTSGKPSAMDAKVRKAQVASVSIPLVPAGNSPPIVRLNALPIVSMPSHCFELSFAKSMEWDDLRTAQEASDRNAFFTKADRIWGWGSQARIREAFGKDLQSAIGRAFPANFKAPENLHFQGFAEEALCAALARKKPLLSRTTRSSSFLIVDPHTRDKSLVDPLFKIVGATSGVIAGLFTEVTEEHPHPEKIAWSEALRISIDLRAGQHWLLLDPDIWVWPTRAREVAADFLDERRANRFNNTYNALLDVWIALILGTTERAAEVALSAFDYGTDAENPTFRIGTRTAFTRQLVS